jgi:hypothetical protein
MVLFMRISLSKGGSFFAVNRGALDSAYPAVWYLVFACVALCSYTLSFRYGIDLDDEGLLIGGAADILGGRYPLADFYSYQPWMYFSLAGFFRLFDTTLLVERLFLIVNLMAAGLCLLWLARQVLPPFLAMLPVLLYALAPGPWYKVFFIFHLLLIVFTIFVFDSRPQPQRAMLAGLAAGFALVSRVEAGLVGIVLFVGTLGLSVIADLYAPSRRNPRMVARHVANVTSYALSAAIPLAAFAAVYASVGKLHPLVDHLRYYATTEPYENVVDLTGRTDAFSLSALFTHPALEHWFYGLSLLACLTLFLINVASFFRSGENAPVETRRLIILAATSLASMGYTLFFVWNSRMLSSFAIVYVAEIALLFQLQRSFGAKHGHLLPVAGGICLVFVVHTFCKVNFYSGSIQMRVLAPGRSNAPFLKGATIDASQAVAIDKLRAIATRDPGATLVPMSEATTMGFLSGLPNPTYYRLFTVELFGRRRQETAIETIERHKIKYFVARSGQFIAGGAPASDIDKFAPLMKKYLVSHYDIQSLSHTYVLLTRRVADQRGAPADRSSTAQ